MTQFSDELIAEVKTTVEGRWDSREGQVVPQSESLRLANDRVVLDAVLLYADLADSTEMAIANQQIASEVFKSYLRGVTKIVHRNEGHVRSFDGDRVMGVFIGDYKNTNAARCGLQIHWFFSKVLTAKFREYYTEQVAAFNFDQTVGIDRSSIYVARSGVRDNNDLIWVGRAPNIAAKLSTIRMNKFKTFITPIVYKALDRPSKFQGTPQRDMWTLLNWTDTGNQYGIPQIYGSEWIWEPE
jgi:class 3 adenylate cyclase